MLSGSIQAVRVQDSECETVRKLTWSGRCRLMLYSTLICDSNVVIEGVIDQSLVRAETDQFS